jgi:hypothetical protein
MITTDYCKFSKTELEAMVKYAAKLRLIGPHLFVGNIGDQHARWLEDGSIEVLTEYERGTLPVIEKPLPQIGRPAGRPRKKK